MPVLNAAALRLVISLAMIIMFWSGAAQARRVALVIGNGAYQIGPLENTLNDAEQIAQAFEEIGFDKVILHRNLGLVSMMRALRDFNREVADAEVAVVFYAGHGTEVAGRNYLIPVDARLAKAADIDLEAIALDTVLSQLGSAQRLKLVILDACRNNVFQLANARRSLSRGLSRIEPDDNTLVAYAAKDGTTASDGEGRNSPFTTALLTHLRTPGLEINFLFRRVRDDVIKMTRGLQVPFVYGSLGSDHVYLNEPRRPAPSPVPPVSIAQPRPSTEQQQAFLNAPQPPLTPNCDSLRVLVGGSSNDCIIPGSGKRFRDCLFCPEMTLVPAGSFLMGAANAEHAELAHDYPERVANLAWEIPQSAVTINAPFGASVTHVTRGEFATFARDTKYTPKGGCYTFDGLEWALDPKANWQSPGFSQTDQHPAVCISWDDAAAYVEWLSRRTGQKYRLLSEAEIEYVSRARSAGEPGSRYFFGDQSRDLCVYGNGADDQARKAFGLDKEQLAPCDDGFAQTAPVARYKPNAWGLHDVFGNVWTWTLDCWNESHALRARDPSARRTGDCEKRVVRGGSWSNAAIDLRAAVRDKNVVSDRSSNLGFRLGRDLD